ncbi:MAG: polymer-forming cytoskeletal protein [Dethiobacteria bacterium]|jgi:cytoskeletal protein CcmA (bactofilin family)
MLKKPPIETPPDKVNLVIGKDTYFKGSIKAKGLIRIDGEMEGEIDTQGDVIIGEGGRVNLDLKARHVAIAGRFEGNLEAVGKLEIRSSGIVVGSVKTNALVVDDGAIFSGNLEMKEKDQQVKPLLKRVGAVDEASKDKNK